MKHLETVARNTQEAKPSAQRQLLGRIVFLAEPNEGLLDICGIKRHRPVLTESPELIGKDGQIREVAAGETLHMLLGQMPPMCDPFTVIEAPMHRKAR